MSPRLRCTVTSLNYSACGMSVGDWFELGHDGIRIPDGRGFCVYALSSALPTLRANRERGDIEEWLATQPQVQCPDPPESLRMLITAANDPEGEVE